MVHFEPTVMTTFKQTDASLIGRNCVALILAKEISLPEDTTGGLGVFSEFLLQNSMCFWNACLTRGVQSLEYKGWIVPCTLLVSGTDFALEVVRSAWARRVLRPPKGYAITSLGDVGRLELVTVPQTQFAPLTEALCKAVTDLNAEGAPATADALSRRLAVGFPGMQLPTHDLLYRTLGQLIRDRKLYHNGNGYLVVSPSTYRQRAPSPPSERQMLMTNEEALVRMHGSVVVQADEEDIAQHHVTACQSTTAQVTSSPDFGFLGRSHSLRVLRMKKRVKTSGELTDRSGSLKESTSNKRTSLLAVECPQAEANEINKCEKQSMLAKLLKRMQALTDKEQKHVTFSAQFPPLDWLGPEKFHCHSVATQTHILFQKVCSLPPTRQDFNASPKIPWEDFEGRELNVPYDCAEPTSYSKRIPNVSEGTSSNRTTAVHLRQGNRRHSPPHRYSHGATASYNKRRHKHRSSSESPKVQKPKRNGFQNQSSSSKSPAEDKVSQSSFSSLCVSPKSKNAASPCSLASNVSQPTTIQVSPVIHNEFKDSAATSPSLLNENNRMVSIAASGSALESPLSCSLTSPIIINRLKYSPVGGNQSKNHAVANSQLKNNPNVSQQLEYNSISNKYKNNPDCNKLINNPVVENSFVKNNDKCTPKLNPNDLSANNCSSKLQKHSKNTDTKASLKEAKKPVISELLESDTHPISEAQLALSESGSEIFIHSNDMPKKAAIVNPPKLKKLTYMPKLPPLKSSKSLPVKEIIIDNSVSVEVDFEKVPLQNGKANSKGNNVSTTVVTEETTVTKGSNGNSKVVTVTSITTSLSRGGALKDFDKVNKDKDFFFGADVKDAVNDLNIESDKGSQLIDCTSSCNIVTEMK